MHIEERTLDVEKKDGRSGQIKPVILRRGEKGQTQIKINLTSHGMPYSTSGTTAKFHALLPDKKYVIDSSHVTVSSNYVTYTVQDDLTSADGDIRVAYVELVSSGNSITSDTLPIIVLKNTDISTEQATQYQNQIDKLTKELETAISKANTATASANSAATSANTAASNANTARTNAANAATSANNAATAANTAKTNADKATQAANSAAEAANTAKASVDKAMEQFRTISSSKVDYQVGTSGTIPPTGTWLINPPSVPQGRYLWARTTTTYNKGNDTVVYAVAFQGRDGSFAGEERMSQLEERMDSINDITTGINLLRGTRDFTQGSTRIVRGASTYTKDYLELSTNWIRTIDEEGFTVVTLNRTGLTSNNLSIIGAGVVCEIGKTYTISVEVKIKDKQSFTELGNLFGVIQIGESGETLHSNFAKTSEIVDNEWCLLRTTFTVDDSNVAFVAIRIRHARNGCISARKAMLQEGAIQNPIWAQSPFDTNDITTSNNMIIGTRDFVLGTVSNQKNPSVSSNGFRKAGSGIIQYVVDEEGFTNAYFDANTNTTLYTQSIDLPLKPGDVLTYSMEMKPIKFGADSTNTGLIQVFNGQNAVSSSSIVPRTEGLENYTVGEWNKVVRYITIPENYDPDTYFVVAAIRWPIGYETYFRKCCIYKGHVNNPEWAASLFDVVHTSDMVKIRAIDIKDKITANNGYTVANAMMYLWGRMAHLYIDIRHTNTISKDTNFSPITLDDSILPYAQTASASASYVAVGYISKSQKSLQLKALADIAATTYLYVTAMYFVDDSYVSTLELPGGEIPVPLPGFNPQTTDIMPLPGGELIGTIPEETD